MRMTSIVFLVSLFVGSVFAQSSSILTTEDVMDLLRAGMDENIITALIETKSVEFDTSPEALIALKEAGASKELIATIIRVGAASTSKLGPPTRMVVEKKPAVNLELAYKWNGMVLDETSPEEAIRRFGDPVEDRVSKLKIYKIENLFSRERNRPIFRKLVFKTSRDSTRFKKIITYFKDNRLVMLELFYRDKLQPEPLGLSSIFGGLQFKPFFSGWDEAISPDSYERLGGELYAKNFPPEYAVVAVTKRSVVNGIVKIPLGNLFSKRLFTTVMGRKDRGWPGKVQGIQFISRTLEPKASL